MLVPAQPFNFWHERVVILENRFGERKCAALIRERNADAFYSVINTEKPHGNHHTAFCVPTACFFDTMSPWIWLLFKTTGFCFCSQRCGCCHGKGSRCGKPRTCPRRGGSSPFLS